MPLSACFVLLVKLKINSINECSCRSIRFRCRLFRSATRVPLTTTVSIRWCTVAFVTGNLYRFGKIEAYLYELDGDSKKSHSSASNVKSENIIIDRISKISLRSNWISSTNYVIWIFFSSGIHVALFALSLAINYLMNIVDNSPRELLRALNPPGNGADVMTWASFLQLTKQLKCLNIQYDCSKSKGFSFLYQLRGGFHAPQPGLHIFWTKNDACSLACPPLGTSLARLLSTEKYFLRSVFTWKFNASMDDVSFLARK